MVDYKVNVVMVISTFERYLVLTNLFIILGNNLVIYLVLASTIACPSLVY